MAPEYPHIFLDNAGTTEDFTSPQKLNVPKRFLPRDRQAHSDSLRNQLDKAWTEARKRQEARTAVSMPSRDGVYIEFEGAADCDLVTKSLENLKVGIRLLNVHTVPPESDPAKGIKRATVFIPTGRSGCMLDSPRFSRTTCNTGLPSLSRTAAYCRLPKPEGHVGT